jgi:hypothetical protein
MKFLQCACIVGAVAALSPLTARGPSNVSEPARADAPAVADGLARVDDAQASVTVRKSAPVRLASLEDAHANLVAAFAAFAVSTTSWAAAAPKAAAVKAISLLSPKALSSTDPLPVGALPRTRLAYAAVPDVTLDPTSYTSPPLERETPDFSYLADYVYSETPPPEKPADTVLRAFKEIPHGTPREEVRRAAQAFGLDVTFMEAVAKIESDFDPKQRTGSYIGLYQLSKYEFDRYGSGDITDARDNAIAGIYKFAVAAKIFELETHNKATPAYLYLIHQQGTQGAAEHVSHPDRLAWESMCATEEGKAKGERWCKRAIWQNTLPEVKKIWGSVERMTSAGFVAMWRDRVATLYRRYAGGASAAALQ